MSDRGKWDLRHPKDSTGGPPDPIGTPLSVLGGTIYIVTLSTSVEWDHWYDGPYNLLTGTGLSPCSPSADN